MAERWDVADRLSDRIVDLVNEELATMRRAGTIEPREILAGQLLGLLAFIRTAPRFVQPPTFQDLERAARACLNDMVASKPEGTE